MGSVFPAALLTASLLAVVQADASAQARTPRCDALDDEALARALALELPGGVGSLVVEPVPCGDRPLFYRVQIQDRVHYVTAPPESPQEDRVVALAIAHVVDEIGERSRPGVEAAPDVAADPWRDPRPRATEQDLYRWYPTHQMMERSRPSFGVDLAVGGAMGYGGGGVFGLTLRHRFARALTLGVETDALLGRRSGDPFRTFSTRAFVGLDSRWFGLEALAGVLTPRRGELERVAPTFGIRLSAGVPDSFHIALTATLAATNGVSVDTMRAEVTGPITLRTRFRFTMGGALRAGHARMTLAIEQWVRGHGEPDSLALGAEAGAVWLWRDERCEFGDCSGVLREDNGRRSMGGLLLQMIIKRRY